MSAADLQAGRLEQACPDCGTWEAAGSVCSKCLRPMTAADWYRNGDKAGRAVAHERAAVIQQTRVKRGPGRPSRASLPDDGTLFGMTTPLRRFGDGSTSVRVPLSRADQLEPSPNSRERVSPVEDTGQ